MNRRFSFMRCGLMLSLLVVSSTICKAQTSFARSVFFDTSQSNQILNIPNSNNFYDLQLTLDKAGQYLSFGNTNGGYAHHYDGTNWTNLLPRNLPYDTGVQGTEPGLYALGGGKALIIPSRSGSYNLEDYYLSDGSMARSVITGANLGDINPAQSRPDFRVLRDDRLYMVLKPTVGANRTDIVMKQGDQPLTRINTAPLVDPRSGNALGTVWQLIPTTNGFAINAESGFGTTLFEYQNGGLRPIIDSSGNYFGGTNSYSIEGYQTPSTPQDGYVFRYNDHFNSARGVGLFQDGQFTKIVQTGQTIPNSSERVIYIGNAWLDGDKVLFDVESYDENTGRIRQSVYLYEEGNYTFIDDMNLLPVGGLQPQLSGFVNGTFFVRYRYEEDNGASSGYRIYSYTAVPEPGSVALFASLAVIGIGYTHRKRRN